jgi:hypothetical protein
MRWDTLFEADPGATDRRMTRWRARFGAGAACQQCGFDRLAGLTKTTVASRAFPANTTLCFTCDAMQPVDRPWTPEEQARRARWIARLGAHPICLTCGFTAPRSALIQARRPVFERHHPSGRHNDPALTVLVCLRCHAMHSEDQRTIGVPL